MTRRLFLHVGMPKCATTSLQAFLGAERKALGSQGFAYRMHPGARERYQGNGAALAHAIVADDARWREILDFHLDAPGDVIVSSELLFGVFNVKAMHEVAAYIRGRGFETYVVAYFRRQDEWLESDFKQQVKGARPWAEPVADWVKRRERQELLNYAMSLTYFGKFFGRDHIRPVLLRRGQRPDFAAQAFLDVIGAEIPPMRVRAAMPSNVSPPAGLIEPARLIKARLIADGTPPEAMQAAVTEFLTEAPRVVEVPQRRYVMTRAERKAIVDYWHGGNRDLEERFLDEPTFDREVPLDPASEEPIAPEAERVLEAWLSARGMPTGAGYPGGPERPTGGALTRAWRRMRGGH